MKWLRRLFRSKKAAPGRTNCHYCHGEDCVERTTRLMGDVVPYEYFKCAQCPAEGYGARL